MTDLWHYTCSHSARRLGRQGVLRANAQPYLHNLRLVWATDLDEPDRDALGLSSVLLKCDRTAARYRVLEPERFQPWSDWWPQWCDPVAVSELTYPPRQPAHWWVSTVPALAERA